MNGYKELVDALRCGAWSVYKVNSPAAMCETIYNAQIADAIEQLVKERDAAVAELRKEADNCKWCKWWKPYANFKYHCTCPNGCCVDGNPDRWEWRGVQE